MAEQKNILEVRNLVKHFPIKRGLFQKTVGHVRAVDDVSFTIGEGKTFGLVGESGSGKTTVGRTLLRLEQPTGGQSIIDGKNVFELNRQDLRMMRPQMQIIFQDPYSSLDPRMPVGEIVGEAVREHAIVSKEAYRDYILEIMDDCGLRSFHIDRYPHEFSGGQRQRICIARALALQPKIVVADEPVSALDVSIQAQIINLMHDLQAKKGLTYLFISHDLSVVEYISDDVGVMYLGKIVELAPKKIFFNNPLHPYSTALLSAVPEPNPDIKKERSILKGDIPSPANPPSGCRFHTRCVHATELCSQEEPLLREVEKDHLVACHYAEKIGGR